MPSSHISQTAWLLSDTLAEQRKGAKKNDLAAVSNIHQYVIIFYIKQKCIGATISVNQPFLNVPINSYV